MVLTLKRWKSRSSPGIEASALRVRNPFTSQRAVLTDGPFGVPRSCRERRVAGRRKVVTRGGAVRRQVCLQTVFQAASGLLRHSDRHGDAGWSSPVARQAHNLKVAGSNPAPATKFMAFAPAKAPVSGAFFAFVRTVSGGQRKHAWTHRLSRRTRRIPPLRRSACAGRQPRLARRSRRASPARCFS